MILTAPYGSCYPQNPGAFIHSLNMLFFSSTFTVPRGARGNRRKEQPLLTGFLQDRGFTCEFRVANNL